jgi:hypothetical protein
MDNKEITDILADKINKVLVEHKNDIDVAVVTISTEAGQIVTYTPPKSINDNSLIRHYTKLAFQRPELLLYMMMGVVSLFGTDDDDEDEIAEKVAILFSPIIQYCEKIRQAEVSGKVELSDEHKEQLVLPLSKLLAFLTRLNDDEQREEVIDKWKNISEMLSLTENQHTVINKNVPKNNSKSDEDSFSNLS